LKLDDLLMTAVDESTEDGRQQMPGLEQERHIRCRKSPVSGADR
jgi:hypothetical protein